MDKADVIEVIDLEITDLEGFEDVETVVIDLTTDYMEDELSDDIILKGTVISDENYKPLSGITVKHSDSDTQTKTNSKGEFKLKVKSTKGKLIFESNKHKSKSVSIGDKDTLKVKMKNSKK